MLEHLVLSVLELVLSLLLAVLLSCHLEVEAAGFTGEEHLSVVVDELLLGDGSEGGQLLGSPLEVVLVGGNVSEEAIGLSVHVGFLFVELSLH